VERKAPPYLLIPSQNLLLDEKSVGALTNDGIEDVEVDIVPETAAVRF
jgi:hypothetical protein